MIALGKRLISVFLVLVVSLMLMTSPASADTSSNVVTLTPDNFQTEVLKSDKPVAVIVLLDDGYNSALAP